jgi:hypothetical protein
MRNYSLWLLLSALLLPSAGWCRPAAADPHGETLFNRDQEYEQNLRYSARADKAITPARVLRWLRGVGDPVKAFTEGPRTEFRPIVKANESQVQVIAAVSYKF